MKKGFVLFAVALSLPGVACAGEVVVSNGVLWAESPLDFEIGSTEYAQMLGERLRSRAYATFDPQTKVTTTNLSWETNARLATPFYGNREVHLGFTGADRRLDTLHLFNCPLAKDVSATALSDSRKAVREIASDITRRRGVKMRETSGMRDDELQKALAKDDETKDISHGFAMMFGRYVTNDVVVTYWLSGYAGNKRGCHLELRAFASDPDENGLGAVVSKEERRKAHAEAARMRASVKRVFGTDLDAEPEDEPVTYDPAKEWTALDVPVAGMLEKKESRAHAFFGIPMATLSLRRAYDGDVEAAELESVARGFLAALEKAYGAAIPAVDDEEGRKTLATMLGDGVPAYGDTRAALQLDRTQVFVGKVGDIAIEVAYALPQYLRKGDAFEVLVRGAVVAHIVQMPIVSAAKTKK